MVETPTIKTGICDAAQKRLQNWTDRYLLSKRLESIYEKETRGRF
jgi:hypothetical protein